MLPVATDSDSLYILGSSESNDSERSRAGGRGQGFNMCVWYDRVTPFLLIEGLR